MSAPNLQEGSLCLTAKGWAPQTEQVKIETPFGVPMTPQVVEIVIAKVRAEHQSLLGPGDIRFVEEVDNPEPGKGYIIFTPTEE